MSLENDSLKGLNERNAAFWQVQSALALERLSDEALFKLAQHDMISEAEREVPVRSRKTLEKALADAADTRKAMQAAFSRKGGKAYKSDALNDLIEDIDRRRPTITDGQLLWELKGAAGAEIVTSVDSELDVLAGEDRKIHYMDYEEQPKTASVSGLRYRLARVRKKTRVH